MLPAATSTDKALRWATCLATLTSLSFHSDARDSVGVSVGTLDGCALGWRDGCDDGREVAWADGLQLGSLEGCLLGKDVG